MPNRDPESTRRDSSPQPSSRRPPQLDLFSTSTEELHNPLPSPPYRREPSTTHLYLGPYPEESPAYKSRSNVDLYSETSAMVDSKHDDHDRDSDGQEHPKASAKTARFKDDIPSPEVAVPPFRRTDSEFDFTTSRSRSPSIADTDDGEIDDYDWEAEEDLVDQEARFEQNMGMGSKNTWGFRKYVANRLPPFGHHGRRPRVLTRTMQIFGAHVWVLGGLDLLVRPHHYTGLGRPLLLV